MKHDGIFSPFASKELGFQMGLKVWKDLRMKPWHTSFLFGSFVCLQLT